MSTTSLSIIGGGLAGLVSAVRAAELGASVDVYEAGGRATDPPYVAHDGLSARARRAR